MENTIKEENREIDNEVVEHEINLLETQIDNDLSLFMQKLLSKKLGCKVKVVKKQVASGVVYVPRDWIGSTVIVLKANDLKNENQKTDTSR